MSTPGSLKKPLGLSSWINQTIPSWNLEKVLALLQSPTFVGENLPRRIALMKALFLTALACGNRVSELAAIVRSGVTFMDDPARVLLPVSPGFLFKNQRLNRTPNIEALALDTSDLCPVAAIRELCRRPPGPGETSPTPLVMLFPLRPFLDYSVK